MSEPFNELVCRVYIDKATRTDVESILSVHFSFEPNERFMKAEYHEIEVRRNNEKWREGEMIDFTYWQAHVEIYGATAEPPGCVDLTTTVLRTLWEHGYPAVAACDFEHELPWSGGGTCPEMPPVRF